MDRSSQINNIQGLQPGNYTQNKRSTVVLPAMTFQSKNVPKTDKKYAIRPESPRTKLAAQQLGIDLDQVQIKYEEDFGGPDISANVRRMRFEHYMGRMQSDILQVQQRRRELINEQRRRQQQQQLLQEQGSSIGGGGKSEMVRSYSEAHIDPLQMTNVYNKTVNYLKNSHDQPTIKEGVDIFEDGDSEGAIELEDQMFLEIEKFNKLKQQKQKEARLIYEGEVKKLVMMKEMQEKQIRLKQNEEKQQKDKAKQKFLRRKEAQSKLESIKDQEKKYRQRKQEERAQIKARIDQMKEKQQKEAEIREHQKYEQDIRNSQKKEKMAQILNEYKEKELEQCQQVMVSINDKLQSSQNRQNELFSEKLQRYQEKQQLEQRKFQEAREFHEVKEQENISKVVQKMVEKEQQIRKVQDLKKKQEFTKKKEKKQKDEILGNNKEVQQEKLNNKMEKLQERFERIEENLKRKKAAQEERIKIQQEERRLKQLDKIENNERTKRKEDYRLQSILDREQQHRQQIQLRKQQLQLLQKTKQEVSVQYKKESDRIFQGLTKVSDKLFPNGSDNLNTYLTPESKLKGFKVLNSIFQKNDIAKSMIILNPPPKSENDKQKKI